MRARFASVFALAVVFPSFVVGCGSSDDGGAPAGDSGVTTDAPGFDAPVDTGHVTDSGVADSGHDTGGADTSDASTSTAFKVRIENVSGTSARPTPISPGVWVLSGEGNALFDEGKVDRGEGLEHLAEDGNPTALAASLAAKSTILSGTYDTAVGATKAGPALPGSAFEIVVHATPKMGKLTFASMFGQSNDVFVGTKAAGIDLFDASGKPLAAHDASADVALWDVGTEHNQPPGLGPDQAPRQPAPNTGASEGVVDRFTSSTRGLPVGRSIVDVAVTSSSGAFTFTVKNVSGTNHAIITPISPIFYATHASSWSLFTVGTSAKGHGLEHLAEDGNPASLVTENTGAAGVGTASAIATPDGASSAGPALTGSSFTFTVTPDAAHPNLSFASMVGETNDAFLALPPSGVALLDGSGAPRAANDVQADVLRMLSVWDAGTEANQTPGAGSTQAPRQSAPNTGPDDPTDGVRLYDDWKSDLTGDNLGGFVSLSIVNGATAGSFDVTIMNSSGSTGFSGKISPTAWALHDTTLSLFDVGKPARMEIERVAEDGNATPLGTFLSTASGVGTSGVVDTAVGATGAGPIGSGQSYTFTVTPDAAHRFFSLAAMVAPSNDTFLAFDPGGVALLDASGAPRSDAAIAADIVAHLRAWDAGTEENQSGAVGPDQAGHQSAPNTGADEGESLVRAPDSVWGFPAAGDVVKVTITPM